MPTAACQERASASVAFSFFAGNRYSYWRKELRTNASRESSTTKLATPEGSPGDSFQSMLDLGEFAAFVLDKLGVNLIVRRINRRVDGISNHAHFRFISESLEVVVECLAQARSAARSVAL